MLQSTFPAKKFIATVELSLNLTMGSGNGLSQIDIIVEAITNHRDYYLQQMFSEIKNGEYENAYSHYRYFKDLSYLLDHLVLDLADLAHNNYVAATDKGDTQARTKLEQDRAKRWEEGQNEFLQMIRTITPGETE